MVEIYSSFEGEALGEAKIFAKVLEFGEYLIIIQTNLSSVYTFCINGDETYLETVCSPDASIIFFDTKEYKKYFEFHTSDNHDTYVEMFVKVWMF